MKSIPATRGALVLDRKQRPRAPTAVARTARQLRDEILLLAEPGVFLGSEEELMGRMQVSRATFRQAIRLLEHEGLLTIKRGNGGGFFSCQPSAESVARAAAVYLQFNRTPAAEVLRAATAMQKEAVRLIASSSDPKVRNALKSFIAENQAVFAGADRRAATRMVNQIHTMIASLSGNAALELFMNVIRVFGSRNQNLIFTRARLCKFADMMQQLADAIAAGDTARAEAITELELNATLHWLSSSRDSDE